MKVFAISDLHLTNSVDKPMDIFGTGWVGHWDKIRTDWMEKVTDEDVVTIPGDISWGMTVDEAIEDLRQIDELPGKKVICKGNHDYWWQSYKKLNELGLHSVVFLQNNAQKIGKYVFCGTRGWTIPDATTGEDDVKIFHREIGRLEMSLREGVKVAEGGEVIGMMHYPPFNAKNEPSPFTELFEKYGVKKVVYGHLHGENYAHIRKCIEINGVAYRLIACDFLNFSLIRLC